MTETSTPYETDRIECARCPACFGSMLGTLFAVEQLRREAAEDGWLIEGETVLCPECRPGEASDWSEIDDIDAEMSRMRGNDGGWLSVNEKLPPDGQGQVDIYSPEGGVEVGELIVNSWFSDLDERAGPRNVTYWQPRPEPPA